MYYKQNKTRNTKIVEFKWIQIRQYVPINSQCYKVNFVHTQQYNYDLKINENKGKFKNPSQQPNTITQHHVHYSLVEV
jgi:hypothetical protein